VGLFAQTPDAAAFLELPTTHIGASAIDVSGSVYITGVAYGPVPVTAGAYQTQAPACASRCGRGFVVKVSADGKQLLYATYLAGSGIEQPNTIAVDSSGIAYIAGFTTSKDFPVTAGAYRSVPGNGFVSGLNPAGASLIASTYVAAQPWRLTLDGAGNVYVVGRTFDPSFAATPGAYQSAIAGQGDAFILKIDPMLHAALYATLLGGGGDDTAYAVTVDAAGSAYVAGEAKPLSSADATQPFPVTPGAYGESFHTLRSAFVARLSSDGSTLLFSSLLAGGTARDVAIDESGNVYFTGDNVGALYSLPVTTGAFRGTGAGFAAKLNADASRLLYSTRLPGSPHQLFLIGNHHVLLAGTSYEQVPTTPDAPRPCSDGKQTEQFLLELNATASDRVFGTYLKNFIATDGGTVWSAGAPGAGTILDPVPLRGTGEIGITCVANSATFWSGPLVPGEIVSIFGIGIGPDQPAYLRLDSEGNVDRSFGGVTVFFNGVAAPLTYASRNQINAVIPFELDGWPGTFVTILKDGVVLPEVNIPVTSASPGVFALVNQDGTINGSSHPAATGSYMTLYLTGVGLMSPAAKTGSVGQGTTAIAQRVRVTYHASSGFHYTDTTLTPLYAGDAPTLVQGVAVIVFQVAGVPSSQVESTSLNIGVGGAGITIPITVR